MSYIIRFADGYYYEQRGGFDWGRTNQDSATRFHDRLEAERIAKWIGRDATVEEDE